MTDAELVAAIADGQVQALRELHQRHAAEGISDRLRGAARLA